MNETEKQQLETLLTWKRQMESSSTIPLNVNQALKARLLGSLGLTVSTKDVDSEDVTVSEGGASSYAVMNDPDGFLQVTINDTVYYIPYFT